MLGRRLRCLFAGPHFGEGLRVHDVCDRKERIFLAIVPGGLTPARRLQPALLAEERKEDLCLLFPKAGQGLQAAQYFLAIGIAVDPEERRRVVRLLAEIDAEDV